LAYEKLFVEQVYHFTYVRECQITYAAEKDFLENPKWRRWSY